MTKINHNAMFVDEALGVDRQEFKRKLKQLAKRVDALDDKESKMASKYLEIIDDLMTRKELLWLIHMDIARHVTSEGAPAVFYQ